MSAPFYNTGNASVTTGTKTVTLAGGATTTLMSANDRFYILDVSGYIASITDATHFELAENWPGATATNSAYQVWFTPDDVMIAGQVRSILDSLSNGILQSIAGLSPSSNDILQYNTSAGAWTNSANLSTTNITYTGTLTGGTGIVNIGTGQIYKDAGGNVGFSTTSPGLRAEIKGAIGGPASSGTAQTGIMRLSQSSGTLVLDVGIGVGSGANVWLQGTNAGDLSAYYPLLLNPNSTVPGTGVGIGTGTSALSYMLEVHGTDATVGVKASNSSTAFGLRLGVVGDTATYGGIILNMSSGELQHIAGRSAWGGFHTFYAGGSEAMRITSGGTTLLGTTATIAGASETLHVEGALSGGQNYGIMVGGATSGVNAFAMRMYSSTAAAVVGSIQFSGTATTYNTSSDANLKLVGEQRDYRAVIKSLWVGDFTWKADGSAGFGVQAQQAYEHFPFAISKPADENEYWQADYSKLAPLALWGVKDLYKENAELRARIAVLEERFLS